MKLGYFKRIFLVPWIRPGIAAVVGFIAGGAVLVSANTASNESPQDEASPSPLVTLILPNPEQSTSPSDGTPSPQATARLSRPIPLPSNTSPTLPTTQAAIPQVGPGGCDGVEAAIVARQDERMQAAQAGDLSSQVGRLGEYIFLESPYEGFEPGYDGKVTAFDVANGPRQSWETPQMMEQFGFKEGYERDFIAPNSWRGNGFIATYVFELSSPEDAVQFDNESLRRRCQSTKETFSVPEVRGLIGLSTRGSAPPVEDQVSFIRGPRRYVVIRGLGQPPLTHSEAADLARRSDKLAR